MAQLFRVTNHRDSSDCWTFTFLLPATIVSPNAPNDVISRELLYAGNRWRVHVSRREGTHLSPSLELLNSGEGLSCTLDYGFTLINQDSYTQNERFVDKQREFSDSKPRHGARTFIHLDDLTKRQGFFGAKHDLILELMMRSAVTVVKTHLRLPLVAAGQIDCRRYDTSVIRYGAQEWRVVFCPNMDVSEEKSSRNRHLVQLQRVNNSETMCRMRYSIILGNHKPQFDSKLRDELFDFTGSGEGIYFSDDYMAFTETDGDLDCMLLPMTIHLRSSTFMSHIKLSLIGETDDPRKDALATVFVDKDRQSWRAMAHSSPDETLAVTVLYQDLRNVPAGYLRYVCWTCKVLSLSGYVDRSILVDNCPLENFYVQNAQSDRGVCMSTKMSIQQILAPDSVWLNRQESRLTVEINWLASHLLVQPTYNAYDHVLRRHAVQLRREVEALQAENFSLEKDMHSYQQSIANKCASSNHSQATTPIGELNPPMPHGSATHTRAPGHHRGSTGSVHSGKSVAFSTTQSPRRLQLDQENWREAPMTAPSTGRRASGDRRASDSRRASDTEGHLLPSVPIDSGLKESRSSHYHRNNSSESTAADYGRESIPRRPYGESPHRQRRQPSPTARVDDNLRRNSAHQTLPVDDRLAAVQTRRFSANPNPGQLTTDEYEAARSPRHRSHVNRNRIDERNQYPEGHYSSQRPPIDHSFDTYRK